MNNTTIQKLFFYILIIPFLIFACDTNPVVGNLKTEELFSLKYGNYEDEFHLYTSEPADYFSSLTMRDGFFYIADSASKKVNQFSSYGDLVSVLYNPETNPVPEHEVFVNAVPLYALLLLPAVIVTVFFVIYQV